MENWKEVEGYEGAYQISSHGRLKSLKYGKELIRKPTMDSNGYYQYSLYLKQKQKMFLSHRLVAMYFIENVENLPEVNHKDCNKLNNNVSNLEWSNRMQNVTHAVKNNLYKHGSCKPMSKITESQAVEIYKSTLSSRKISEIYGISKNTVLGIKKKIYWRRATEAI